MIWNSIPLMTAIDLLIIAVTIYAIWRCRLIGPSKRPSAPQIGLRLIVLGLAARRRAPDTGACGVSAPAAPARAGRR
jgi:hypothetical protein